MTTKLKSLRNSGIFVLLKAHDSPIK